MRPVVVPSGELPEQDARHPDEAKQRSERQSRGQLAQRDLPPILDVDLAQRERPNDEGRRLGARVAARADDQRHEQGEHDGMRDLALEVSHRGRRQHLAQEERGQPAAALPDHRPETDRRVRLVERFHAAKLLDVLRLHFFHDVDHVVDRDDTHDMTAFAHHGHRDQVVVRRRACHFLPIRLW